MWSPLDELAAMLRPAGGGVYLVSTGRAEQLALQRRIYAASSDYEVDANWRAALERVQSAKIVILGIPSDVGAGYRRGANLAPSALRTALLDDDPGFADRMGRDGIVDLGDVRVVPQLLHDEMLSEAQIAATRDALYPDVPRDVRDRLPVSPLSIAERVLDLVLALNPNAKPLLLGGDHSTAWPAAASLSRARAGQAWGIVQIDAHTDLLEERLGIRYCFATWSFHAARLLGRPDRMVQVGIRASRYDRAHWESTVGVRQLWADEVEADPARAVRAIVDHLRACGVTSVYFSNDIDGTDAAFAEATGTPEPHGLHPDSVVMLLEALGREIGLCAADVMEVAPPLGPTPEATARTVATAVRYLRATISALLAS